MPTAPLQLSAPPLPVADPSPYLNSNTPVPRHPSSVSNRDLSIPSAQSNLLHSSHRMVTRIRDNTPQPKQFKDHVALVTKSSETFEPKTYNQAKGHPHWVEAMNKEHMALLSNHTWELFLSLQI